VLEDIKYRGSKYPRAEARGYLLTRVRLKDRKVILQEFDYALDMDNPYHNQKQALKRLNQFINKWSKIYPSIGRMFIRKEEYFTYLEFPFG